jgi:hypothetical protein
MSKIDLTQVKKYAATLALFGLTETIIDPPCPVVFAAAWKIISTESVELKRIATTLEIDFRTLQKDIFKYLKSRGFIEGETIYH